MSERLGIYSHVELKAAKELVRELIRVVRSFRLYEASHPALSEMQIGLRQKWDGATAGGPIHLTFLERKVLLENEIVYSATTSNQIVPTALYDDGVVGFVLNRGIDPTELRRLVEVLAADSDTNVDYAAALWEADLTHVQVLLDTDDADDWDDPDSPQEFAEQIEGLGDARDPQVGVDYDDERTELGQMVAHGVPVQDEPDRFELTEAEHQELRRELAGDTYRATALHAMRVVHNMARIATPGENYEVLARAVRSLMRTITGSGDLDAAAEILGRAQVMMASPRDLEARLGELTRDCFREPPQLWSFLNAIDRLEYVDERRLHEFLIQIGPGCAATVGDWLIETNYPEVVARAMRGYGDEAVKVLVPLYLRSHEEARSRITPSLLRIGSPEALVALAGSLTNHSEEKRGQLLQAIARNPEPALRRVIVDALCDPSQSVRRIATGSLRKQDAPMVAKTMRDLLADGELEERSYDEAEDLFEMLSRIGDGEVASVLADHCMPRGFRFGRWRPTALQKLCLRSLRRMRAPSARAVVEELRETGPKPVRDALDDALGDY